MGQTFWVLKQGKQASQKLKILWDWVGGITGRRRLLAITE